MFGIVTAARSELTEEQRGRYGAVYCGICRRIRIQHTGFARLGLSYDMAFLALFLMSLYEPEETSGKRACGLHPVKPRPWVDNEYIRYAADLNVVLAYYKCMDDVADEGRLRARLLGGHLKNRMADLEQTYPRQCQAVRTSLERLSELERAGHSSPDAPANTFGELMGELLVFREDLWAPILRQVGFYLGRFIYLSDAIEDYDEDIKHGRYNPLNGHSRERWDDYLVLAMGRCTDYYERLPLVQDKAILDNILYSGVWVKPVKKDGKKNDRRSV